MFIHALICYLSSMQSVPTSLNYLPGSCAIQNHINNLVTEWLIEQKNEWTDRQICDVVIWIPVHTHELIDSRFFSSNLCSIALIFAHTSTSLLLLYHMHTLIFHQYSPPGPPYASASIPWGECLPWHCDFQLTNFTQHGKMSPWITLELLHVFKSIQKTIKSNRTALSIAVPSLCLMTQAQEDGKGRL